MTAYCWATGLIEFTSRKRIPKGALTIATAPAKQLRPIILALACHGCSKGVLLVPGVAAASMLRRDPVAALITFTDRVKLRLDTQSKGNRSRR